MSRHHAPSTSTRRRWFHWVPLTFPQKLLALLLLAVVTPAALSVFAFSEIMRTYMEDRSTYDGRSLGGVLATNLSGRVNGGWDRADRVLMDYLAADDAVAFICVTDSDGRPIHMSVHEPSAWEAFAESQRESFQRGYLDISRSVAVGGQGSGLVIRTVPIYPPDAGSGDGPHEIPEHEGYVVLGVHDVSFLAAARQFQLSHVIIAAVVTLAITPLILLSYVRWTQPLRHLRANVIKLADGKAPTAIEAKEDDDIGRLVSAVDRMAGSVLAAQRQLRDTNINLESIVQQRTIELREAVRELEQLSTTDVLTGLANRRAFYRHLEDDFARAAAYRGELSIVMIDLDGFKQVNDTFGHDVGDDVLIIVGEAIMSCADPNMMPARLGGDEFVVLMRHLSVTECETIATHISGTFNALMADRMSRYDPQPTVTMSMGLASLRDTNAVGGEILMAMADMALYKAKSRGRACLVVYDESMAPGRSPQRHESTDRMEAA